MAVTQYIGARYVPLLADPVEWDITRQYEPLTIVTYQGASYTSRQAVPADISITDGNYWVLTGNYNAQVEQYRREVQTFDGRITDNASAIAAETAARIAADTAIDDVIGDGFTSENTVSDAIAAETAARIAADTAIDDVIGDGFTSENTVSDVVANLVDSVSQLTSSAGFYSYFKNKNCVIIGDSYAYGTGASDHLAGDTKRWSSLLCAKLGATEFNYAVGSTGFCDPGSSGQNMPFYAQVEAAATDMNEQQRNDTHLVVIAGGINDYREGSVYGFSAMRTGAYNAANSAKNAFVNALILVVPMLFNGHEANPRLFNFENAILAGCTTQRSVERTVGIRGAWTWNFGVSGNFVSDALHPNDDGHAVIAANIYSHILGGAAYVNELIIPTFESGYSSGVANGGYLEFHDGKICSYGWIVNISGSIESGGLIKIASVSGAAIPLVNIVVPISKANAIAGCCIITTGGNVYIKNESSSAITSDCFVAPFSYLPSGSIS